MANSLQLGLYGNNQGANNVIDSVEQTARETGVGVTRLPGLNVPIVDEIRDQFYKSDAIILGISTGDTSGIEARLALEAAQHNPSLTGKIVFIEDFPGSSNIQDADHQRVGHQSHLCSIMQVPPGAREHSVYKHIHAVGLPDHWIPSMQNIVEGSAFRTGGSLKKRRRRSNEHVPVSDEVVLYLSGFKDPVVEKIAIETLLRLREVDGREVLVHFRPHPGEVNQPDLAQAIAERDALLAGEWELASPEIVDAGRQTDSRLIGVSDVPVVHPAATSIFLAAALRRRMLSVMELATEEHRSGTSFNSRENTPRYVHVVERLTEVRHAIGALLCADSPESQALLSRQIENYSVFDTDSSPGYGRKVMEVVRAITS